jgi:tetratricopeptide (TPR) repeat protein
MRARLLALLGKIAARQGRLEEALGLADQAQSLVGPHPAFDRVRGDAYAQTWHWADAARVLTRVTEAAPGDTAAWRDLARARMSAGDPSAAWSAAIAGLKLQPRDEGLLRCEALSLEALGSPDAPAARAAFLFYREADETSASRILCDRGEPYCARDRQPVVTLSLERPVDPRRGRRALAERR